MQLCKPTAMSMYYMLLNPQRCEIDTFWTEFFIFAILQSVDDNDSTSRISMRRNEFSGYISHIFFNISVLQPSSGTRLDDEMKMGVVVWTE